MTDEVGTGALTYEGVHDANASMRYAWLEATMEMNQALEDGDTDAALAADDRRNRIREKFMAANIGLAMAGARDFLVHATGEDKRDHEQAALLGLWEGFYGTDPVKAQTVTRDDNGFPVAACGWDPARSTFGGFSRKYVTGKVRRSVASNESGLSYAMWTQRQTVLRARDELAEQMKVAPNVNEVAAATGFTREAVAAILTPRAVSLQTPLGADGGTLEDMLADESAGSFAELSGEESNMLAAYVRAAAPQVRTTDLMSFLLRVGLVGRPSITAVEAGARLGLGRGSVGSGVDRVWPVLTQVARRSAFNLAVFGLARADQRAFLALFTAGWLTAPQEQLEPVPELV